MKLFQDHEAEQKLSNNVAHVKKLIDQLQQQIIQIKIEKENCDKHKRSCFIVSKESERRLIKALKHKRR